MADETRKLQKDPPEGSRKVIEHELERQSRTDKAEDQERKPRGAQESGARKPGRGG
jgi:hypothetical protein